ncbi:glucoamylase [Halalkalicoccus sp. NIPERK01]|uniref:glucoamylase n=1 Tax=Halalkalicoccus sp. NIPERK01 TaxID=3053469 RepID=UPI00256F2CD6|nr:glucoamylase [Halalkalicoccus sp. NIPERK01]MDL5363174.1 glucoamylase [Halalkalicoccus sp. NIPERK01]
MTHSQQTTTSIVPQHVDAPIDDPAFHLDVLAELSYDADVDGAVPLASNPDNRYPYVYPRDVASITRAWLTALRCGVRPDECRDRIVEVARFLIAAQDNGWWYQRYGLDGEDQSIYQQEDNVAHGIRILSHAVLALDESDDLESAETAFLMDVVDCIEAAVTVIRSELYDANAHLIESTTSIHEGAIESGYTLWVNCAFLAALTQTADALDRIEAGDRPNDEPIVVDDAIQQVDELRSLLKPGVERCFAVDGTTVPRRYTLEGERDDRPDITLLAPAYFELDDVFGDHAVRAAERATASLEDPRLGGLQRFWGFHRDHDVHQHGGNGPWMQYTAWHAQFRYDLGERERGDEVLSTVTGHADADGHIPEHLSTRDRFEQFIEKEWNTGVDFEKEFDADVLRDVPFDRIAEELGHMRRAYDEMATALEDREVIAFAAPLAWCHAEFLTALLKRDECA